MNQSCPPLTADDIRVRAWAEVRELLELQLAPLGRRALAVLAPQSGEKVLDIGCGGGTTTLELARAVAPDGMAMGIDPSAAVLAFAQRAAAAALPALRSALAAYDGPGGIKLTAATWIVTARTLAAP